MPKPCSKPLKQNPFESYRDPVTGQWKVRYPASSIPAAPCSIQANGVQASSIQASSIQNSNAQADNIPAGNVSTGTIQSEATPARRRWKKPSRKTKVA